MQSNETYQMEYTYINSLLNVVQTKGVFKIHYNFIYTYCLKILTANIKMLT